MSTVHWEIIEDEIGPELDRLGRGATFRVTRQLQMVHAKAFADTQVKTHVLSGSLKASGKSRTSFTRATQVWEGVIEYGGELVRAAVPGPPRDPVEYAIYERARGGEHDFMRDLPVFQPMYRAAVVSWLNGDDE